VTFDVICPGCKGRFHETTDQYTEKITPDGSMFRLKEPYRTSWRWSSFPERSHVTLGALECPGCGASYLVNGRVIVMDQLGKPMSVKKGKITKESTKKKPHAAMSTVDELF